MVPMVFVVFAVVVFILVISSARIVMNYERLVVFRLGRSLGTRGPGFTYVLPIIEKARKIDVRTITHDVPAQDVITRDNISIKVSAVLLFRIVDPTKAINSVENYLYSTSQLAQTTLRTVCGEVHMDELLSKREDINKRVHKSSKYFLRQLGQPLAADVLNGVDESW